MPTGHVHPLRERLEAGAPLVERDDLAVEEHVIVVLADGRELGEGRGHVALVARPQGEDSLADVGKDAHAVGNPIIVTKVKSS